MVLRWTLFVVLVAAAAVLGSDVEEEKPHRDEKKTVMATAENSSKITKREAIMLNNLPESRPPMYKRNAQVVYKKIRVRPKRYNAYALAKPKRNSSPHYRRPTKSRRQTKNGPRKTKSKHSNKPSSQITKINHAGRSPAFGPRRPPGPHPSRGPPHAISFGEPPEYYYPASKHRTPSESYGEPPQNSYTQNVHPTYHADSEYLAENLYDSYTNPGHIGVASNYRPGKSNPQSDYFIGHGGKFDQWPSNDYAKDAPHVRFPKTSKMKMTKHTTARPVQAEVLVGGRYAEPPGRYVKDQGRKPTIEDYEQVYSSGATSNFEDEADVPGLTIYSDYLNGNHAFRPPRMNDVFLVGQ